MYKQKKALEEEKNKELENLIEDLQKFKLNEEKEKETKVEKIKKKFERKFQTV